MARHTGGTIVGLGSLLSTWRRALVDEELSAWTEASPEPGIVSTEIDYPRLYPQISGAQWTPIELVVVQGGTTRGDGRGLELAYRLAAEPASELRGLEAASTVRDSRLWGVGLGVHDYATDDTTTAAALYPASGRVACYSSGGGSGTSDPSFAVWNPHVDDFENGQILAHATYPAPGLAVQPATERLLLACSDATWVSDDYGASWSRTAETGYADASSGSPTYSEGTQVRAVWDGTGALLLVAQDWGAGTRTDFYASADYGASWTEVARWNPAGTVRLAWDVAAHPDGSIFLAYYDANAAGIFVRRLGSAYDDPTAIEDLAEVGSGLTAGAIALAIDENGTMYLYRSIYPGATDPEFVDMYYSRDGGLTWTLAPGSPHSAAIAPTYTSMLWLSAALVPCAYGGLCGPVAIGVDAGGATPRSGHRQSAFVRLGGWSTDTHASVDSDWGDTTWYAGWGLPTASGYTSSGTGAQTYTDGGWSFSAAPYGYVRLDSGALAGTSYYTDTVSATAASSGEAEWIWRVEDDGGGAATSVANTMSVRFTLEDSGANAKIVVSCRVDSEGFRVYDGNATAWLGSKVALDMTVPWEFRMAVDASGVTVWYRSREIGDGTSPPARTQWERSTWDPPSVVATGGDGFTLRWGIPNGYALAALSFWVMRARTPAIAVRSGLDVRGVAPGGWSYPLPDAHDPVRERLAHVAASGSGAAEELYSATPRYGYPLAALFPGESPSPDTRWRSTATDADVVVAVAQVTDAILATHPDGQLSFAIVARKCNFRKVQLRGYPPPGSAASYTTLAQLDLASEFVELAFTRNAESDWLLPDTSVSVVARYLRADELAGGFVILDPDGLDGSLPGPHYLPIRGNSPGWWDTSKGLRARIYVDGIDDALHPQSGGLTIVHHSGVLAVLGSTAIDAYSHVALVIPADTECVTTYFEAGFLAPFALAVPGKRWADGRVVTYTPNVRAQRDAYGTETREQTGPTPRSWSVSWDHGTQERRVRSDDQWLAPIDNDSGAILAARDDVYTVLAAWYDRAEGGVRPVLLLPAPVGEWNELVTVLTITDPTLWLVGHVVSDLRVTQAVGDDGVDEHVLPGAVEVRELV